MSNMALLSQHIDWGITKFLRSIYTHLVSDCMSLAIGAHPELDIIHFGAFAEFSFFRIV